MVQQSLSPCSLPPIENLETIGLAWDRIKKETLPLHAATMALSFHRLGKPLNDWEIESLEQGLNVLRMPEGDPSVLGYKTRNLPYFLTVMEMFPRQGGEANDDQIERIQTQLDKVAHNIGTLAANKGQPPDEERFEELEETRMVFHRAAELAFAGRSFGKSRAHTAAG